MDGDFREVQQPQKLQHSEKVQAVMEYELPPNFSVYTEWSPHIYHRSILRNRHSVSFDADWFIRFSFSAIDESHVARLSGASFLSGVFIALAGSAIASVAVYGVQAAFSRTVITVLAALGAIVVAAIVIGMA